MTDRPTPQHESRLLIDGKLVDGEAGTFDVINPATEKVIGAVADASHADVQRAIDAARHAFDETSWSTDRAFRKQCLGQLQQALEDEQEELREELIAEVGCPRMVTHGPQLDLPLADGLRHPIELIDTFPWEQDLGDAMVSLTGTDDSRKVWHDPVGVVGAIVPVELPVRGHDPQARSGARHRQHRRPEGRARHPVQRDPHRTPRRRAHRHPARRAERRHRLGPPPRRGAHPRPTRST